MRRKVMLTVLCLLFISDSLSKDIKTTTATKIEDNESAASVNKLISIFKDAPLSIYASAVPHGAFSFHVPQYQAPAKLTGSLVPVNNENIVIHKQSGYLTDSYGNKFLQTPQSVAYKTTLPQQYVALQDLPAHLSQPLVAGSSGFHFKQVYPQFSYGSPFHGLQAAALKSPFVQFGNNQQTHAVYNQKNPVQAKPAQIRFTTTNGPVVANVIHQPSNKKIIYSNGNTYKHSSEIKSEPPKFQKLEQGNNKDEQSHKVVYSHSNSYEHSPSFKSEPVKFQRLEEVNNNDRRHHNFIYSNTNSYGSEPNYKPEVVKFQRLEHGPHNIPNNAEQHIKTVAPPKSASLQAPNAPAKQVKITTTTNGQKTIISLPTQPPLPHLLDLSLLEPLVFDNPIVPQVQHYLPRINYNVKINNNEPEINMEKKQHKEFLIQNTKVYGAANPTSNTEVKNDSGEYRDENQDNDEPQKQPPTEFKVIVQKEEIHYDTADPVQNLQKAIIHKDQNEGREPNYYFEVKNENSHEDSNEEQDPEPKHLIYSANPEAQRNIHDDQSNERPERNENFETHNSGEQSEEDDRDDDPHHDNGNRQQHLIHNDHHHGLQEHHKQHPRDFNNPQKHVVYHDSKDRIPKHYSQPLKTQKHIQSQFQPLERVVWHPKPHQKVAHKQPISAAIKVPVHPKGPSQPVSHVEEKSKGIIIKEEIPVDSHSLREQMMAEVIKEEENNEEDFEKAYKAAAYGFPGQDHHENHEKDIYNPDSYGEPRYHEAYDIKKSPFKEFYQEPNEFSQSSHPSYKDMRDDRMKQYLDDYKSKQPKQLEEYSKLTDDYFKMYKQNKPSNLFANYKTSKPETVYVYKTPTNKKKENYLSQYKAQPIQYEYKYAQEKPKDSYAYGTKPNQSYRHKFGATQFVEPQFQYGFEPIPKILDSELAAMASNDSPESEKPGIRKKIYKENWYIKKTSTTGGKAAS